MYEHERSLVTKMKQDGKPFALIGVNVGDSLEKIQQATAEKGLNWRSFFCGEDPKIPSLYNIQQYPTIVFIDGEGVVRGVSHQTNDELIHELLDEMKK